MRTRPRSKPTAAGTHLNLPYISGVHCIIRRENNRVELEDRSSNGTYINDDKVGKGNKRELRNLDVITLFRPQIDKNKSQLIEYIFTDSTAATAVNDEDARLMRDRNAKARATRA